MKRFLKLLIGLGLMPLCWAMSKVLLGLLVRNPGVTVGGNGWALPAGFAAAAAGFFMLPRPFRTYVLGHELTHAVCGLLMGARVGKMKVGKNGGHVMLSKSNFLISLAPYFFPFYTGVVAAVWAVCSLFTDTSPQTPWWLAAVGLTWGFHVTFTVYMLAQKQPDIQENGRLFSYAVIYLANLFFVVLWVLATGLPHDGGFWSALSAETGAAYGGVCRGATGLLRLTGVLK